jgi:hypothetical protein
MWSWATTALRLFCAVVGDYASVVVGDYSAGGRILIDFSLEL